MSNEDLKEFEERLHKKTLTIYAINNKQGNKNHTNFENKFIKNYRVSKIQPKKYKKVPITE